MKANKYIQGCVLLQVCSFSVCMKAVCSRVIINSCGGRGRGYHTETNIAGVIRLKGMMHSGLETAQTTYLKGL